MKKTGLLALMLTLVLSVLAPALDANAASKFSDVADDYWAVDEIGHFAELGVVTGFEDGTFRPENDIKRADAAIMIARGFDLDIDNPAPVDYADVDEEHYAYKEIAAVSGEGIMQGFPEGDYRPNATLTRAQMAVLLTNAFDLTGNQSVDFTDVSEDHYAFDAIDAIFANELTTGYDDNTFKPDDATKRSHFVTFLDRALNSSDPQPEEDLTELLKEVYANEMELDSYEFEGSANVGLTLPESFFEVPEVEFTEEELEELGLTEEELAELEDMDMGAELEAMQDMLSDIQVDINGSYQKDPMQLEADVAVTMAVPGETEMTMTMPMIMTETKMWMKFPESPLFPMPEEIAGKYIEFDLEELANLEGMEEQPPMNMDMELQTELAAAIFDLFFDQFGKDFYSEVPANSVNIPSDVDADTVVKFELTNENLESFITVLFEGFLPGFFDLLENEEYAEAMGLTVEDIQLIKEELKFVAEDIELIVGEINSVLDIKKLEEIIAITDEKYIGYDLIDIDLGINLDDEELGIKLKADSTKSKVNEDVNFEHGIPSGDDVITIEELMELEMEFEEEAAA